MSEVIHLPDVKRIEGHGRISLFVDDDDRIEGAHFDVMEFRGFEKMVEGRMVWEMPLITSRICGVCPVSHHLAAVKAIDAMYSVELPRTGRMLREMLHLGGFVQDHALHFFLLAGPDFLVNNGEGSRDILGVISARPDLALKAIGLRKTGQNIVATVGGRASHPVTAIPGGMSKGITTEERDEMLAQVRGSLDDALFSAELARESTLRLLEENPGYGKTPMPAMALLTEGDTYDVYDGTIVVMAADGTLTERFAPSEYFEHIGENVLPYSYAKTTYLLSGGEGASFRVGPLSRINMAERMPGPRSSEMLEAFHSELGRPVHAILAYHWARMIELVAGFERLEALLSDEEITSDDVRVKVERGAGTGIAAIEAPRGTLIHHYEADEVGRVTKANLIVATTNNTASLDDAVAQVVEGLPREQAVTTESVRQMEMGIRAHDPCLSCATHEVGRMPFVIEVIGPDGSLLERKGVV